MATLTIRDLDDSLKRRLRMRAAGNDQSMEEEARQILRAALEEAAPSQSDLVARIRSRVAALGDVQLPIAAREPIRPPPSFEDVSASSRVKRAAAAKRPKRAA